jgi:hypothetical protein
VDRREGHWLSELAAVDAGGAVGAEQASRLGDRWDGCGPGCLRAPGCRDRGADRSGPVLRPLAATATALLQEEISPAQASVLAHGTHALPTQVTAAAEPVLLEAAGG